MRWGGNQWQRGGRNARRTPVTPILERGPQNDGLKNMPSDALFLADIREY